MLLSLVIWVLFLPVQCLLAVLTALVDLLSIPFRRASRTPDSLPDTGNCTIVVLNWNGRALLEESLPALSRALREAPGQHRILLVDNGSDDDSLAWVGSHYPEVRCLSLGRNLGFGEGNNRGVEACDTDIVVLLNNDMIVEEDFLEPLLQGFSEPDIFAVTGQVLFPPEKVREETGNTAGALQRGFLRLRHRPIESYHEIRGYLPVLWAGGGSSAFRRETFLRLGGFSPLFSPCYVEDTDLSYRAWRAGLRVLFTPHSRVLHKHRSSSRKRFSERKLTDLIETRKLWYLWKNFQLKTLVSHFTLFPLAIPREISLRAYCSALAGFPACLAARLREPRRERTDRRLLDWIGRPLKYLDHFYPSRHQDSRTGPLRLLVSSAYLPHLGRHGGAGRVFQLLSRVAGHLDVTLASFVETDDELNEVGQTLPLCKRVETVFRRDFEPVSCFPYEPFEEFNCPNYRALLERLLLEDDFDLVHFEWTQMVQYQDLFPNLPKLVTEIEVNHAAHRSLIGVEPNPVRKVRKYYNALQTLYRETQLCNQTDSVICVTDADAGFLKGFVPSHKLKVINTGVDTSYFTPSSPQRIEPESLVYVGAYRHDPNVDAMLYFVKEVFPLILKERPTTHLYVVGSSPPSEIRALDGHPNITVTGFVDDIRTYYALAQVVIVPLRTGVGIRGKILEGWAAGKAMVATPLACLGIRALHGENIMIAQEAADFALWTLALLRHPQHCRTIGEAGREQAVRHYEWDQVAAGLVDIYQALPDGSHPAVGATARSS